MKLSGPKAENNTEHFYSRELKAPIAGSEEFSFYIVRQADSRFRLTVSFSFTLTSTEKSIFFEVEIDVFTDFTFSTAPLSVKQLYKLYLLASNAAKGKLNEKIIPFPTGRQIVWKPIPFSDVERKLLAVLKLAESRS